MASKTLCGHCGGIGYIRVPSTTNKCGTRLIRCQVCNPIPNPAETKHRLNLYAKQGPLTPEEQLTLDNGPQGW